ncbi:MAG TPA: hypothetical protein VI565_02985, partial [Burkholderiales bacterium]|nr:hypothetical protein [Burkholderiales bacterium]
MQAITETVAGRAHAFSADVKAELVRYLHRQAPGSMIANLIVSGILVYVLWNTAPQQLLVGWLLAVAVVCALRLIQVAMFFRAAPPPERIDRWAIASAAGSVLIG